MISIIKRKAKKMIQTWKGFRCPVCNKKGCVVKNTRIVEDAEFCIKKRIRQCIHCATYFSTMETVARVYNTVEDLKIIEAHQRKPPVQKWTQ